MPPSIYLYSFSVPSSWILHSQKKPVSNSLQLLKKSGNKDFYELELTEEQEKDLKQKFNPDNKEEKKDQLDKPDESKTYES